MQPDLLFSVAGLCAIVSFSPGPTTILAASVGASFGVRASLPLCIGAGLGYASLIGFSTVAIGQAIKLHPLLDVGAGVLGGSFLLWIAWKIANSGDDAFSLNRFSLKPLNLWEAIVLQWINPKAWAASSALASQVLSVEAVAADKVQVAVTMLLFMWAACLTWSAAGSGIAKLMHTARRRRIVNSTMGLGLAAVAMHLIAF